MPNQQQPVQQPASRPKAVAARQQAGSDAAQAKTRPTGSPGEQQAAAPKSAVAAKSPEQKATEQQQSGKKLSRGS